MLFNSIDFAVFLPIVFVLYWFVTNKNLKLQNALIVVSSYVFYGWWDWKFLLLIAFSTIVDYGVGLKLKNEDNKLNRKILLWTSILVNLGLLGFFKYYNFFLDNFITAFSFFGSDIKANSLNIILPVGISFYTFQTLSYTIDVYKRKLEPTKDFIAFSAFVCFFPQLVAGPIERASKLLPQFYNKRTFDYAKAVDGMRQILWGLFKKIVIADNCAEYASHIFNNSGDMNGSTLAMGVFFFAIQIYGDFSGYSDIAIGTSRLFGIKLSQNFAFPYFSRDIPEFWRRWHISLTTWFRDYLFIPLVKSYSINKTTKVINVCVLFIVIGFWHGAEWTFISWGGFCAIIFLPSVLQKKRKPKTGVVAQDNILPSFTDFFQMLKTFCTISLSMIFFRAESISHAFQYFSGLFSISFFEFPKFNGISESKVTLLLVGIFFLIEWFGRKQQYALERLPDNLNRAARYAFYYAIIISIFLLGGEEQEFIYFQF